VPVRRLLGFSGSLERQYALAAGVFAILVLGIIFLFGHLISQSLSRRYLEDVLISGREEAERIAEELTPADGEGIYDVFEKRQELLMRDLQGVPQRKVWDSVEVTDADGEVVFRVTYEIQERLPESEAAGLELSGALSDRDVRETQDSYQIAVPLGEVGEVVLNVSKGRLAGRVQRLRQELLRQTVTVAGLTLTTLVIAFVFVWLLIRRTLRLEAQRREAEELAALGTLAANLAHEIRNPLNSINLNLELLEEDLNAAPDDARGSLHSTRREVARLGRLVSDFLTYARPTQPHPQPIRVAELLTEVVEFLRAEASSMGVHLRMAVDLADEEIECDPAQLRQVLFNLVLNAVQAVSELPPERRLVELDAVPEEEDVVLVVRDRGKGIPEEDLERVRSAFYTRRRGGTGLGLAIANRFVTAHGGRIDLVNLEPSGFEARVVLPLPTDDVKMTE
jgi:signal transduction histidine kinase